MDFGFTVKITILTLFFSCQVGKLLADFTNKEIASKKNVGGTDPCTSTAQGIDNISNKYAEAINVFTGGENYLSECTEYPSTCQCEQPRTCQCKAPPTYQYAQPPPPQYQQQPTPQYQQPPPPQYQQPPSPQYQQPPVRQYENPCRCQCYK